MEETKCFFVFLKPKYDKIISPPLETYQPRGVSLLQHGVICKRSLLYDQTIEDINIFSSAYLGELRGWLNLPGGSTYPTLPYMYILVHHQPLWVTSKQASKRDSKPTISPPPGSKGSVWTPFWYGGGGGGARREMYRHKKRSTCNLYARVSASQTYIFSGLKIHVTSRYMYTYTVYTMNAVPFYYLWYDAI